VKESLLLFAYRDCVFRVPDEVQPPKAGSLFFCRHVTATAGERVLEIGAGMGLTAVLLARVGARVVATDVVPEAVAAIRTNAALNGVSVEARQGDAYEPVAGERFDLICANLPQMPTPPGRERKDAIAAADNGGHDGWEIIDRVLDGARDHLAPRGRVVFSIFAFLGRKRALARLSALGLTPSIVASEVQGFPRIGYERLEHLRAVDAEGTIPVHALPETVERFIVQGRLA
jgi:release factor glutamine methyltransferase